MTEVDGRTRHYGGFYGVVEPDDDRPAAPGLGQLPGRGPPRGARPRPPTWASGPYAYPPVHELVDSDVPHVQRLAAQTAVLLSQPIRPGYRDLPLGTDDVAAGMPDDAVLLRWPVVRWSGLEPFSAIVRDPDDPVAPTRRWCRTTTCAPWPRPRGRAPASGTSRCRPRPFREVAQDGLGELRRREQAGTDVAVSDLLLEHGAGAMHTHQPPRQPGAAAPRRAGARRAR